MHKIKVVPVENPPNRPMLFTDCWDMEFNFIYLLFFNVKTFGWLLNKINTFVSIYICSYLCFPVRFWENVIYTLLRNVSEFYNVITPFMIIIILLIWFYPYQPISSQQDQSKTCKFKVRVICMNVFFMVTMRATGKLLRSPTHAITQLNLLY